MPARPIPLSTALLVATVVAGLALRFAHLGLPQIITKYSGSTFWAIMIYWLVSSVLPRSVPAAAIASCLLATAVEFFKLIHTPALDAFRLTLPGILLLGRFFSPQDIVAYCLAIFIAALADTTIRRHYSETAVTSRP